MHCLNSIRFSYEFLMFIYAQSHWVPRKISTMSRVKVRVMGMGASNNSETVTQPA